MQAHTRKHPTETIELRFIGPIDNYISSSYHEHRVILMDILPFE